MIEKRAFVQRRHTGWLCLVESGWSAQTTRSGLETEFEVFPPPSLHTLSVILAIPNIIALKFVCSLMLEKSIGWWWEVLRLSEGGVLEHKAYWRHRMLGLYGHSTQLPHGEELECCDSQVFVG